ncbi:MAG TPA: low-specificity L-threonine aldolase [Thermoanaerobaculia bacterium]|nr:low-specificity L-threonine aldolase [Thermoanaerobaculia bacterium]
MSAPSDPFAVATGLRVDLRSDTVTLPTSAMRRAMAKAVVGDDVKGEDPTVRRLEERVAGLLDLETAMFVPSGTQSNLCALLAHCERGDEYVVGRTMHTYLYEGGGAAALGGIQPCPLPEEADGSLDLEQVRRAVKDWDDDHYARTRLLCLENTHHGRPVPVAKSDATVELARELGLAVHLDGARLWNAALALGVDEARLARGFDTVSVCLSKGLGAPVGSVLAGSATLIRRARRWRKVLGGGMRQAGVLAAAGLVALDEGRERLHQDHETAGALAEGLREIAGVELRWAATNMVFLRVPRERLAALYAAFASAGVGVDPAAAGTLRLVTHRGVDRDGVERVLAALRRALAGLPDVGSGEDVAVGRTRSP